MAKRRGRDFGGNPLIYFKEYFGDRTITRGELFKEDSGLYYALRYRGQFDEAIPKDPEGYYRGSPSPLDYFKEYFGDRTITRGELFKEDSGLYYALRYRGQFDEAIPKDPEGYFRKHPSPLSYFKEYFGDRTITRGELFKEDSGLYKALLRRRGQLDEAIPKGGYRGSPSPLDYFKEYFGDRTITKGELKKEDLGLYSALRYHNQLDDAVPKELPFEIGGANILSKWMKRKRGKINKKENLNPLVHEVLTYLNYALISNNLPIYQLCINAKFEERNGKTTLIHTPSVMDIAKMNKRILEEVIDAKCYCHITKRDIKEFVEQLERYSNGTTTNLRLVFNSLNTKEKELLGILPESISFSVIEDIEKKLKDEDKQLYFLIKEKISKDNSFVYSVQYAIKEAIEQKNGSIRTELRKSLKNPTKKINLSLSCFVYHVGRYYLVNRVVNGNGTKGNPKNTTNGWKVLNKSLEYRILPTNRYHIRVVGCSGPGSFATNEEVTTILGYRKESA